jgi:hypothetical protein
MLDTTKRSAGVLIIACMVLLGGGGAPSAADAKEFTLQELLDGASIVIDDKEFSKFRNFDSTGIGGARPVEPQRVTVIPTQDSFGTGLLFVSDAFKSDLGQGQSTSFAYDVRTLSGADLITDNTLALVRFSLVDLVSANITIIEGVSDEFGQVLGEKSVSVGDLIQDPFDSLVFPPQNHLVIKQSILLNSAATVEEFRQDFSQVPEPSTYLLFGTGILGLLGYAWRKRKRAA